MKPSSLGLCAIAIQVPFEPAVSGSQAQKSSTQTPPLLSLLGSLFAPLRPALNRSEHGDVIRALLPCWRMESEAATFRVSFGLLQD
jgi:hypothetical protein